MSKQIVIIGGGPAGMEAARVAAKAGAQVTLINDAPLGGRAGWHSLVPSKVWLNAADVMGIVRDAPSQGVALDTPRVDAPAVLARIHQVAEHWNHQSWQALEDAGVKIRHGVAAFKSAHQVEITADDTVDTISADAVIIATGSVPIFPEGMQPDGKRILAPRFAAKLDPLPASTVVVGAGATGTEFVYLLNRLGVDVTWVVDPFGVLPRFDPETAATLARVLARRGVHIVRDRFAQRIVAGDDQIVVTLEDGMSLGAEQAFLAIGRRADLSRLNLAAAGLEPGERSGALLVDAFCQTSVAGVYAVGDAAGAPMLANQAVRQAQVAARHAVVAATSPYRADTVVHAVYAEPQVAQVGTINAPGDAHVRVSFSGSLKAHIIQNTHEDLHEDSFLTLHYDEATRRVRGASAVGPHAADVLAPVAVAVQVDATVEQLASPGAAYPAMSEVAFLAAQAAAF